MSIKNIEVRDINSYTDGFNLGYQAAEANRKLTSINASIFKSVFYRDYKDSFYRGVASGWQYSFDLKRQKIKADLKNERGKEAIEKKTQTVNTTGKQQLSPQEKQKRFARRQAQMKQIQERQKEQQRDQEQELDR